MPWSKEQEEAIYSKGQNILVAAAAGSGKTAVLVERIIQHLVSGYCNINEILVVTFTKAAASEMQGRIAKAIGEKLDAHQREKQLVLLNGASISTLHSFCQSLLRQYFYHLDLDPKFRLGSQQEINLLKYDVLDALFEDYYLVGDNEDFNYFVDLYGSERGDEGLYNLILRLFDFAQAQPFPEEWISSLPNFYLVEKPQDTPWFKLFKQHFQSELEVVEGLLRENYQLGQALQSAKYMDLMAGDLDQCKELLDLLAEQWDEFVVAVQNLKLARFSKDKEVEVAQTEIFKGNRNAAWDIVKEWKKGFALQTIGEMQEDLPILYNQAKALTSITLAFSEAFAKAKKDRNIIDFGDLEHLALRILATPDSTLGNLVPSPVALELQEKYKEIMVDEYQDTNGVQEAILNLVAGSEPKKFYVGDVKQSIYKFRLAEPELFLHKYHNYPRENNAKRIDLAKNFRSRQQVLAGTNCIFRQIMAPELMELAYGEDEALKYGLDYPAGEGTLKPTIEFFLFGEDMPYIYQDEEQEKALAGYEAEIKFIVDKIKTLFNNKTMVYDKEISGYRPIAYRDIVVLLRSVVGKAGDLADAMRSEGIPVYANIDDGYFQAVEVDLMVSLLTIVDNPQQDIPLTAVLFSVIGNFSQEELGEIKVFAKEATMYEALELVVANQGPCYEKVSKFLAQLKNWRIYSNFHSVPQLLWRIYEDTGYYEYLGGLPEGAVRQANLRALYTRAKDFEATSYRGLFRFLRYVNRLQDLDNDLSVARTLGEGEDVVRIMTIHKSKGLEFPVVFLPNLNKQFNLMDSKERILIHKDLGLGMCLQGEDVAFETLAHQGIALAMNQAAKAEEARVLYVAMTRAREKLIMSGSGVKLSQLQKLVKGAFNSGGLLLDKHIIAKGNSFLDWLIPALARHKDAGLLAKEMETAPLFDLTDDSQWEISFGMESNVTSGFNKEFDNELWHRIRSLKPLVLEKDIKWVRQRLNWHYPKQAKESIPAKLTVTEIKRAKESMEEDNSFRIEEFAKPKFMEEANNLSGMAYGTMVHNILQHLDLKGDLTYKGVKLQIEGLQAAKVLPTNVDYIPYGKIADFFKSPLGKALLKAKTVEREMHFNKLLPAKLFYEVGDEAPDIFLQGVIDLLFEEADGWIVVDYKTDNVSGEEVLKRYSIQLQLYAKVAESILLKPIKSAYLYMISTGEYYAVPLDNTWEEGLEGILAVSR